MDVKAANVNTTLITVVLAVLAWGGKKMSDNNDTLVRISTVVERSQSDIKELREQCVTHELLASEIKNLQTEILTKSPKSRQ